MLFCCSVQNNYEDRRATFSRDISPSLLFSCYWYFSLGIKPPGSDVDHSLPSSAEDKNEWSHTAGPSYVPLWSGQGQFLPFITGEVYSNLTYVALVPLHLWTAYSCHVCIVDGGKLRNAQMWGGFLQYDFLSKFHENLLLLFKSY
jgi:hypothetical protein